MHQSKQSVLTINSSSSSIKFALYQIGDLMKRTLTGKIDRIGLSGTMDSTHMIAHAGRYRLTCAIVQTAPDHASSLYLHPEFP